jgi:hypothetical protein
MCHTCADAWKATCSTCFLPPPLTIAVGHFCGFSSTPGNLCRHVVHALVKGFHAPRPATFLHLAHRQCCCFEILFVFLLFFLVIFCSLCFYFLASSLNYPLFCFCFSFLQNFSFIYQLFMVGFGFFYQPLMVVMVTLMGFDLFMELCHLRHPFSAV